MAISRHFFARSALIALAGNAVQQMAVSRAGAAKANDTSFMNDPRWSSVPFH